MKKTLTVNLGGTVFHIDEDAYRLLDNYLSNLKIHFRKEAGADEIIDDIERRISELFAEKLTAGSQVITITDVEEVIARMGKPEDMEAENDSEPSVGNATRTTIHRRLYRNPDDKLLGGCYQRYGCVFGMGCDSAPSVVAGCIDLWSRNIDSGLYRLLVGYSRSAYSRRETEYARRSRYGRKYREDRDRWF